MHTATLPVAALVAAITLGPTGCSRPQRAGSAQGDPEHRGIELLRGGDVRAALPFFEAACRQSPGDLSRVERLVLAAIEAGRPARARAYVAALLARDTSDAAARLGSGLLAQADGRDSMATRNFLAVLWVRPDYLPAVEHLLAASGPAGLRAHALAVLRADPRAGRGDIASTLALAAFLTGTATAEAESLVARGVVAQPASAAGSLVLARIKHRRSRYEEAMRFASRAESLASAADAERVRVRAVHLQGLIQADAGDLVAAIETFERALTFARERGMRREEIHLQSDLGWLETDAGETAAARSHLESALEGAERIRARSLHAGAALRSGNLRVNTSEYAAAVPFYQRALEEFERSRERSRVAACMNGLATAYSYLGDLDRGLDWYARARDLNREIGDPSGEAFAVFNIGLTHLERGDHAQAVEHIADALAVAERLQEIDQVAQRAGALGTVYVELGDLDRARAYFERSLAVARVAGMKPIEALQLGNLSLVDVERGEVDSAAVRLLRAGELFREMEDRTNEGISYGNLAAVLALQGRLGEAKTRCEESIRIADQVGNRYGAGESRCTLGDVLVLAGRIEEARAAYASALGLARALDAPKILWQAQAGQARCLEAAGGLEAAVQGYRDALETIERASDRMTVEEFRYDFLASRVGTYERLIGTLARLHERDPGRGWAAQAFEVAERAKARALLDLLGAARGRVRQGVEPALLERETAAVRDVSRASQVLLLSSREPAARDRAARSLREAEDRLRRARSEIRRRSPRYAALTQPAPATVAQVQVWLREGGHDLLLELFLGDSASYAWAVRHEAMEMRRLPPGASLTAQVERVLRAIGIPPVPGGGEDAGLRSLAGALLGPLEPLPGQVLRMLVVPDGVLFHLPFEALPAGRSGPLLEVAEIAYLPSSSSLGYLRGSGEPGGRRPERVLALAVGRPARRASSPREGGEPRSEGAALVSAERDVPSGALPFALDEARRVCALFGEGRSRLLADAEATEAALRAECARGYDVLHVACHASVNEERPRSSCIVLADDPSSGGDGLMFLDEIFNLPRAPRLVVLSACRTAGGKVLRGEGTIGLSRGFFHAGSRAVLATTWPVNDRATAGWMASFYARLLEGASVPAAAREAKLGFLRGDVPALRHPYYWAPFMVIGAP